MSRPLRWQAPITGSVVLFECRRELGMVRFTIDVTEPVGGVVKWRLHDLKDGVTTICRTLKECKTVARERVKEKG